MWAFHKPKKFPRLEKIAGVARRKPERQSWEEQKRIVLMMNAMFGGSMRKRDGR